MDRPMFSEMLAERRRQLGYSIGQASRVLRLREDVLIAFEEGDFEHMPKSGYAQGMISSYARYLGLDATEVIDAYQHDLEANKRVERRANRDGRGSRANQRAVGYNDYAHGQNQTFVGQRGLLPTSGGLAGDMGSFSTTRVRSRAADTVNEDTGSYPTYAQDRPYTSRHAARTTQRRSYGSRARGDIETMRLEEFDYDDDLRPMGDRSARQYESASSGRGRRSSRNISSSERPRVRRQSGGDGRRRSGGRSSSRDTRRRGLFGQLADNGLSVVVIAIIVVVLVISVVLVLSVSSCIRQDTDTRTVPVSSTSVNASDTKQGAQGSANDTGVSSSQSSTSSTSSTSKTTAGNATGNSSVNGATNTSDASSTKSKDAPTSVSVSVADGAVSWLEVDIDGKSDIAETITGPWQRTYTVTDSISIQAGDTTAVSVVQDGRQVQFDSMASGIGSVRIQGTKPKSTTTSKSDASGKGSGEGNASSSSSGSTSSGQGSSAKTGNASSSEDKEGTSTDDESSSESESDEYYYEESDSNNNESDLY